MSFESLVSNLGNGVQYDSVSITPALVALMQAVCIYLNNNLQT